MGEDPLAKLPIFSGMTEDEIQAALACTHAVEISAGEQIISQGKHVPNLWFIREGRCEIKRRTDAGCEFKLAELGPSSQFGEMSFFHSSPHSANVIALTDMKLLKMAREDYDQLCADGNPIAFKFAINSLEQMAERLRRTDQWITDLVCKENHQPTPTEWTSFRKLIFKGQ